MPALSYATLVPRATPWCDRPGPASLAAALRGTGRAVRVVTEAWPDETDVRLEVQRDGGGPAVEVLLPPSGAPVRSTWAAVRVAWDDRAVWLAPGAPDVARLAAFVDDLLRAPLPRLAERYRCLG